MRGDNRADGLTIVEVLVVIAVLSFLVALAAPAIQAAREASRKADCANHLKEIGIARLNYESVHHEFPASSGVTRSADGRIMAVDGWSWTVQILPYLDFDELYKSLDVKDGRPLVEPAGAQGTPHADALATSLPVLLCPSFGGSPYANKAGKPAITNYKAMGATHMESLSIASPHPLVPKYNTAQAVPQSRRIPYHPDGACYPGTNVKVMDCSKGLSYTVIAVESVEQNFARWTVGAEATVVGLPPTVEFEEYKRGCYAPKGHSKAVEQSPEADETYWSYCTYLDWDYNENPYDGAGGAKGGKYGPSSHHNGVVNHGFGDASVQSITKAVDVSVYMFLIGRALEY